MNDNREENTNMRPEGRTPCFIPFHTKKRFLTFRGVLLTLQFTEGKERKDSWRWELPARNVLVGGKERK